MFIIIAVLFIKVKMQVVEWNSYFNSNFHVSGGRGLWGEGSDSLAISWYNWSEMYGNTISSSYTEGSFVNRIL